MRTFWLGAASAVALLAPGAAAADTGGYIDLSAGQLTIDGDDADIVTIGGSAAANFSSDWRAQFDVNVSRLSESGASLTLTDGAGHLWYQGNNWAIGAVLSERDVFPATDWSLSLEGQAWFGNAVVEGQAGLGQIELFGSEEDTSNASANLTYYFTDNFSAGVGGEIYDTNDAFGSVTTWTLDAEYQFAGSNSIFASWTDLAYDDIDADGDTWRIGIRHAFGDDTLKGRRQNGPHWLSSNSILPGLFGPSDRRLKRDIVWLAVLQNGMSIYSFRYLWSEEVHVGVMAQDLLAKREWRHAVVQQPDGFFAVNYARLGLRMTSLEAWKRDGIESIILSREQVQRLAA
jgi:hypothetical protein